jgi:hypothetical protein
VDIACGVGLKDARDERYGALGVEFPGYDFVACGLECVYDFLEGVADGWLGEADIVPFEESDAELARR